MSLELGLPLEHRQSVRGRVETPAHIMGFCPAGTGEGWRVGVPEETDPRSPCWGHPAPWASAWSQECRGGSRSPGGQLAAGGASASSPGSTRAPDPVPPGWAGGGAGPRPGPSQGTEGPFFAAQQPPCLPCARLQPPSVLLTRRNRCQHPQTRGCWREALTQRVEKGPEGSRRLGQSPGRVPFKIRRRGTHTRRNPADHHTSERPPGSLWGGEGAHVRIIPSQKAERLDHMPVFPKQTGNAEDKRK